MKITLCEESTVVASCVCPAQKCRIWSAVGFSPLLDLGSALRRLEPPAGAQDQLYKCSSAAVMCLHLHNLEGTWAGGISASAPNLASLDWSLTQPLVRVVSWNPEEITFLHRRVPSERCGCSRQWTPQGCKGKQTYKNYSIRKKPKETSSPSSGLTLCRQPKTKAFMVWPFFLVSGAWKHCHKRRSIAK